MKYLIAVILLCIASCEPVHADSGLLPDPKLTPGATMDVQAADVCRPGYAGKVRNVSNALKKQIFAEYEITSHKPGEYEIDHLISLELGGSNDIGNLWPQSYLAHPGAHEKDALEDRLHALVCSGQLTLTRAQELIKTDWWAAYQEYVHPNKAELKKASKAAAFRADSETQKQEVVQ